MATVTVTQTEDYRDGTPAIPANTTDIVFNASATSAAVFGSNQFGGNPISDNVTITGDGFANAVDVVLSQTGTFSAAGWSFNNWSANDSVEIIGTAGKDTITGSSQNDVIIVDNPNSSSTLSGGDGNDVINIRGDFRGTLSGGNGTDTIGATASLNISQAAVSGIEQLSFNVGGTVQAGPSQIKAGAIATVNGSAGTDAIEILPSPNVDLSGVTFTNWTSGVDTITIDVTNAMGAAATVTGSGQNDNFNVGLFGITGYTLNGGDGDDAFNLGFNSPANLTINGGSGTDTLLLNDGSLVGDTFSSIERIQFTLGGGIVSSRTITVSSDQFGAGLSTHLTVVGLTDPSIHYTFAVNMAAAGTFDGSGLTVQNATVSVAGSSGGDTITGTSVTDSINGGGGNDTIRGGAGNDMIDGGTGFDTAVFSGALSTYTVTHLSDGGVQVSGPDGVDTVHNVEKLQFDDTSLTPVFAAQSFVLGGYGESSSAGGWSTQDQYPRMAADVNGDGRADIVGFGTNGVLVSLGNASGGFDSPVLGINAFGASAAAGGWSSNDAYHRTLGDVKGDGHADIVGFGSAGTYVSLANSDGTFQSAIPGINSFGSSADAGGWSSDNYYHREVADVDGDGKADIVGFGSGGVYVALATNDGSFAQAALTFNGFGTSDAAGGWSSDNLYHRELADVNGDGKADIVGFGSNGVYVALATSGGSFAQATLAINAFGASEAAGGWTSQDAYPRHAADVNGDGMVDLVGFGASGVYVAFATGNGTFSAPEPDLNFFGRSAGGWTTNDLYPRVLADLNHDGAADIVGFGHDGVYTALAHQFDLA
jgi:Ca2+-binding RTX toxin-like protein